MEDSYRHTRKPHLSSSHHPTHQQYSSRQPYPGIPMDPYFRSPPGGRGPPGYHGPPHDYPPARPHPPSHPFTTWPSSSFSSPAIPPPHMNYAPPGDRWNMSMPPFVGGGRPPELRPMTFPNTPPSAFDLNHQSKPSGKVPGFRSHSDLHFANQHHQQTLANGPSASYMNQSKGEWSRGVVQRTGGGTHLDNFSFQNGGMRFSRDAVMELPILQHGQAKRIKTAPQGVTKRHAPKRPLVDVNKEMRVKNSTHLSVACYNLLAQDLIGANKHLYTHCPPEQLTWDYRKDNLLKDLTQSDADILCLQEVQGEHYHRWYQPQLIKQGYTGLFKRRTGSNPDGCALFFREAKLKLLEWKGLEYQRKVNVLNRDNVAVLAKFAVVQDGVPKEDAVFCVANTHLLFNPKAGEVKLAQTSFLLAELHKMATKPGSGDLLPVMVCGDLNSTPKSPLLQFLLNSNLDYANLSALVIAGYFEEATRKRAIPVPLLPKDMNIKSDCTYNVIIAQGSEGIGKADAGKTNSAKARANSAVIQRVKEDASKISHQEVVESVKTRPYSVGGQSGDVTSSEQELTLSESMEFDLELVSESKPMRTTRSVRGAKGKGRTGHGGVNLTDFPSLIGSSFSAFKDGEDSEVHKSCLSGDSSVDGSVLGDGDRGGRETSSRSSEYGCQSRASCNEESTMESLECSVNSMTKNAPGSEVGRTGAKKSESKNGDTKQTSKVCKSVLTHPFKLLTAYPISKSHPSTITTYHQCAFETVDYILFSPLACGTNGTKKNLTGFNLLKRKVLPSTHTLLDLGPQPHQFLSSDHLLLQATFQFSW